MVHLDLVWEGLFLINKKINLKFTIIFACSYKKFPHYFHIGNFSQKLLRINFNLAVWWAIIHSYLRVLVYSLISLLKLRIRGLLRWLSSLHTLRVSLLRLSILNRLRNLLWLSHIHLRELRNLMWLSHISLRILLMRLALVSWVLDFLIHFLTLFPL